MREKLIELLDETFDKQYDRNLVITARNTADHLIANGVTIATDNNKWIPVTERLPDCADTVLAVDRDGIRSTAYYVGYWHGGGDLDENAVTHWMPLPEPPFEIS